MPLFQRRDNADEFHDDALCYYYGFAFLFALVAAQRGYCRLIFHLFSHIPRRPPPDCFPPYFRHFSPPSGQRSSFSARAASMPSRRLHSSPADIEFDIFSEISFRHFHLRRLLPPLRLNAFSPVARHHFSDATPLFCFRHEAR